MTSSGARAHWHEVQSLLDAALDLPSTERDAFLRRACGRRTSVHAEVTALLRACDESAHFLAEPVGSVAGALLAQSPPVPATDLTGARVGSYRIVREAGRGGMGLVFVAERADGEYEKRVALKLVTPRPGLEQFSIHRFREERQILASLEHPGIARMLDGGVTENGTPWFAMELVEGAPIDEHCSRHELGMRARLELFLQVCNAVRYAHARSIVHRDIKPANILVVADGEVKLLDFGIATLANSSGEQRGPRLMTPGYASPEQRAGAPVTPASDVYSLGVLLAKLLGEAPPRGLREVIRVARAEDAARRYRDAGALGDAVRAWLRMRARLVPAITHRTVAFASIGASTLVFVALGAQERDRHERPAVPPIESLVVFPFEPVTADSGLASVGQELATSLGFDVARVGDVRIVGERELAARTPLPTGTRYPLGSDLALARTAGARMVVRGSIERAGRLVRANATVFLAERAAPVAYLSVVAPSDARTVSDSLAPLLLHRLATMRAAREGAVAVVATHSAAALEAYFEGEHLVEAYRMPEAAAAFARALQADSTFRLAAWRLEWATAFIGRPVDSAVTSAWRAHLSALPAREQLLARARLAPRLVDRIALTRDATRRFPDYWPAWLDYGDVLVHLGPYAGIPLAAARVPLERAVQLDPRLLPAWDHLMLIALSEGDTVRTTSVLATMRRLRYDSSAVGHDGLPMLDYYGYLDALLRSRSGVVSNRRRDAFVRLLTMPSRGEEGRFQGGFLRYGYSGARIDAARRALRQRGVTPARAAFEWNEVASAWMARGGFDSAIVALDRVTSADSGASRALSSYRLASVGAWLGGVAPAHALARRPASSRVASMKPGERVELAWVDGVLAVARRDTVILAAARTELHARQGDAQAGLADSSLLAFWMELRGDRNGAIRTMSALERDRFNDGRLHPYRSGIDRLALGRWLRASGRNRDAAHVLMWPEAVITRDVPLATANAVLASEAYLERGRAELSMRDTLAARAHLSSSHRRRDLAPSPYPVDP